MNHTDSRLRTLGNIDNISGYEDKGYIHIDFDIHFHNPRIDLGVFIIVHP